jgi:cell division protein FtsX
MVEHTSPADLPRSLRVRPTSRESELAIAQAVAGMEGVADVVCPAGGRCLDAAADGDRGPRPSAVPSREGMLIVFLEDDASAEVVAAIRKRLEQHAGAGGVMFVDHDDAHAEFAAMFKDEPDMVRKTSPAELPRSLRVKTNDAQNERALAEAVTGMEGVKDVVCPGRGRCL